MEPKSKILGYSEISLLRFPTPPWFRSASVLRTLKSYEINLKPKQSCMQTIPRSEIGMKLLKRTSVYSLSMKAPLKFKLKKRKTANRPLPSGVGQHTKRPEYRWEYLR